MPEGLFVIRPARDGDRIPLAGLFAAVAAERDGIAAEPPVDVERRAAAFKLDATLVADADDEVIGGIWIDGPYFGFGEIGMLVARDWRGRGVGSALVAASIDWARGHELHKLSLSVFPHNEAAIALYRKFEFRGRRPTPKADPKSERRTLGPDRHGLATHDGVIVHQAGTRSARVCARASRHQMSSYA